MICELPARSVTQAEIDRINKHIERIEAEGVKHTAIMEVTGTNCLSQLGSNLEGLL
jgi:hypothetical protein